ncbi:MAG: ethanolamine utilization protein EutA [Candidatus Aeolococcus gillhamiae]|uniref:Ethanolamine utilization protein EutA n=1 Tax=Candidatus Aeolococcus gillhamiae TaxID=3127015 RepID=A0A2W5Z4V9_9BACT|nr:MAG: ethanolamine utilization protein EutA [Candidatus Dormibacter sp. RRmetagenome_bin12]
MESTTAPRSATDTPLRLLVPVAEAKRLLGDISTATFYRLTGSGRLRSVRVGGRRFVRRGDLDRFVADLDE